MAGSFAAVAAVQEEIGLFGARTAAFEVRPDIAVAVDVTHATDAPGVDEKELGASPLGSGPVIGRGSTLSPKVFELLVETAEAEGIEHSISASGRGTSTDADVLQISRAGIPTGLVSIPLRYMHSPVEMVDLADVEATVALLAAFAARLTAADDFDLSRGRGPVGTGGGTAGFGGGCRWMERCEIRLRRAPSCSPLVPGEIPSGLPGDATGAGLDGFVDEDLVAAAGLGGIERRVGAGHQVFGVDQLVLGDGDADADGDLDADRAALADLAAQPLGDLERVVAAGAGQDHEDLLAADPVDRVARPQRRPHRVGDVLQDGVAGGVAELVVDPLEVVEVAEQQRVRESPVEVAGLPVQLTETLLEGVAVEEAGQRVEGRAAAVGAVGLDQRPERITVLRTRAAAAITVWRCSSAAPGSGRIALAMNIAAMKIVPKTMPRGSKRKPRVTAGSANQIRTGLRRLTGEEHRDRRAAPAAPPRRRRPRPPGAGCCA